ncbi:MAG TPA: ATP-binding protein, partial [Terriglobia bacterium]|nr:ATP-binding protein [Terriglobia bacterium]
EYFAAVPKAGTYVMLEVSDTGSGITHEALTHIFEPFFTTKAEGSGLGLSTSYGIVSQSSGYISVRTQPGHGTTVRSYLPCQHEVATDN